MSTALHKAQMREYSRVYHKNGDKVTWRCKDVRCKNRTFVNGFFAQSHRRVLGHEIAYE